MQREIKFRAYTQEMNYYFIPTKIDFEKGIIYEHRSPVDGIYRKHLFKDIVLEQYTGLKDKNGVEIYEGDIVKVDADYGGDHFYKEEILQVEWWGDDACFSVETYKDGYWNDKSEIIGNIHTEESK